MMKLLSLAFLAAIVVVASGEKVRYDGYKVHRITPHTEEQLSTLRQLEQLGAVYWHEPSTVGRHADVMFPPHLQGELLSTLKSTGMKFDNFVDNVQALIDETPETNANEKLALNQYATLEQINEFLEEKAAEHSHVSVSSIGNSFEGRPLNVLKISRGGAARPAIWLDANIHAREWITSAVTVNMIEALTNGEYTKWTEEFDFYILTVMNPDGFVYTKTNDRLWRKTRSNGVLCKGADANRNFDFHWLGGGSSTNPCSETYAGKSAFSEIEAKLVGDYVGTIPNLVAYISLHSYSQYILLPYGHENTHIPQYEQYMTLGRNIANAIATRYGTRFTPGNIVDLLYVASGGSMDYVKGNYNTNLTLTYELRDQGNYGFILPAIQIAPSSEEFLDGFEVIIDALRAGITTPPLHEVPQPTINKPQPVRRANSLLNRGMDTHTFGSVPQPRRGVSPLKSFQRA